MIAPRSRILCVGASHWDLIGRTYARLSVGDDVAGRVERRLGGVALNIALGLAKHGHPVSLCSVVGDDDSGRALIHDLENAGVDCEHMLCIKGASTGHYLALEDGRGDLFAAIADTGLMERNADAIVQQAGLALQSIETTVIEANLETSTLRMIALASKKANAELVANPVSPAKANRLQFLLSEDFEPTIVANLAEACVLLNQSFTTSLDAAKAVTSKSCGTTLVTDGGRPAALATKEEVVTASPPKQHGDVSVTGAGDALLSGFLASQDRSASPSTVLHAALEAAADHMKEGRTI